MATTNPYQEFLRKVYKMRKAQKLAKQTNSQVAKRSAESLEMEVDRWLDETTNQAQQVKQMQLAEGASEASAHPRPEPINDPAIVRTG